MNWRHMNCRVLKHSVVIFSFRQWQNIFRNKQWTMNSSTYPFFGVLRWLNIFRRFSSLQHTMYPATPANNVVCMRYQQRTLNSKTRWETQHFVCSFPGKLQVVVPPGMMTGQVALAHTYPAQVGFCQFFSWVRVSEMWAFSVADHPPLARWVFVVFFGV